MANIKETADIRDVLVIGSGIAGLSAAVSARDAGARVTILERSTEEEYGGNTRWTEAYFRMKSESEVSDDFALDATKARVLRQGLRIVARQAAMDPDDGLGL